MPTLHCPLKDSCSFITERYCSLQQHWNSKHAAAHGDLFAYQRAQRLCVDPVRDEAKPSRSAGLASGSTEQDPSTLVATAMQHIDQMAFRYAQTDAQVGRAKGMASACLNALKPSIASALQPHVHDGVEVGELVSPLLGVFDQINTKRGEQRERDASTSSTYPPLRAYPRELGERPAKSGKRKCIDGVTAFAWDVCLEEALEREIHYDPTLLTEIIVACQSWTRRSREIKRKDRRDPERTFDDLVDGEVWQAHEVLGDPAYEGPPRLAFQGYCDDVDVPDNSLGPAAGHHKLYIQTVTLVNRSPRSRMTMRAQLLSTVCLASDVKIFTPKKIISGSGSLEYSLGATMRRLWTHGILRLPPDCAPSRTFEFRAFIVVWCADGMAMGDVCGTNTSFSKAFNPCNTCEDLNQHDPAKRIPCGFLMCDCGDADRHKRGCACHFRLRTPARDAARPNPSRAQMQALGRTKLSPGIDGIPGLHVACPGPKDAMHTLNEGRTGQLASGTLWHVVDAGWASPEALQRRASEFDWTPGVTSSYFRPNYLPEKLFTSTKVHQPDGSWVWGPHKEHSIPGSASGVGTFVLMWAEFLRPFIPEECKSNPPDWLLAWKLHAAAVCMTLRYHFTFADLLVMEEHFVRSERILQTIPAYAHFWIPKAHWVLHIAHDIFRHGPSRLLTTLLNEMKNAKFKAGANRGNYHNPVKDVALFWVKQSDWELKQAPRAPAVKSLESPVLVSGRVDSFPDSIVARLLLEHACVTPATVLDMLMRVTFHGVPLQREDNVLLEGRVYSVQRLVRADDARLVRADDAHYILLHEIAERLHVDALGSYYVHRPRACVTDLPARLLSLSRTLMLTCLWTVPVDDLLYLVPRY